MPEETYNTPGVHIFVVPDGVDALHLNIKGAGSGGRQGGRVVGATSVAGGNHVYVCVGEQGKYHSGRNPGDETFGSGGAGGRGRGTGNGGDSGGGASWVSLHGALSDIRGLAGGAGGNSGDGANGGEGGASTGGPGVKGPGSGDGANALGGTQNSPGTGGNNPNAPGTYDGGNAVGGVLGRGGRGGSVDGGASHGGGGGGGGWYSGGGGNASGGNRPAGSGAGGSNFNGGLHGSDKDTIRGGGPTGNGEVVISWTSPPPPNLPPPPPSDLKVNGIDLGSDTATQAMTEVTFTANLANPDGREYVMMVVRLVPADTDPTTQEWNFDRYWQVYSEWALSVADGSDARPVSAIVTGLQPNTKYYVRAYAMDSTGLWSQYTGSDPTVTDGGWTGGSFWTNRPPQRPELLTPSDNASFEVIDNIFFSWTPLDEDENDSQTAWEIRTRRLTRPHETVRSDWLPLAGAENNATSYTTGAVNFTGNQFYMWSVRTRDNAGVWSEWSSPRSLFVEAATIPPVPLSPAKDGAVVAGDTSVFTWDFRDPVSGGTQVRADIRYRVVGTEDWVTFYGDGVVPGSVNQWLFPLNTFIVGYHYEWAVRTTSTALLTSDWSGVETFWATQKVGQDLVSTQIDPSNEVMQPPLGCGVNRVFIYDRGGEVMRGEITGIATLRYGRKRDDISQCDIIINDFSKDCGALLSDLRTWMHEIVVFRDGKRVWEGPVTRITDRPGQYEIEAKDVMVYLYRRIMRQGYNDTYRKVNGVATRGVSVVHRAMVISMNALAYDDPNVLPWLTEVTSTSDARQMRAVPDYSKTAWEEIDDLAATAGLDYTVAGRRIIYWDTHRAIGRLPEMRDEHFSEPVHITEYGMQLANFYAVTNNDGTYGVAFRGLNPGDGNTYSSSDQEDQRYDVFDHAGNPIPPHYGWVEQLVSAYGEAEGDEKEVLSEEAKIELEETLRKQAVRGIAARWPAPVVVRVPDNSHIMPDVNIGFDQLVPGVWIPVRSSSRHRSIAQWQKLDSVTVEQTSAGERIMVTMSPAPNGGQDPDADSAALEA
jgi:hypothetical protein